MRRLALPRQDMARRSMARRPREQLPRLPMASQVSLYSIPSLLVLCYYLYSVLESMLAGSMKAAGQDEHSGHDAVAGPLLSPHCAQVQNSHVQGSSRSTRCRQGARRRSSTNSRQLVARLLSSISRRQLAALRPSSTSRGPRRDRGRPRASLSTSRCLLSRQPTRSTSEPVPCKPSMGTGMLPHGGEGEIAG
jgi:hypothetical protein